MEKLLKDLAQAAEHILEDENDIVFDFVIEEKISNLIRNHLSYTNRVTTKEYMFSFVREEYGLDGKRLFSKVWNDLIKDGYLKECGCGYTWEI